MKPPPLLCWKRAKSLPGSLLQNTHVIRSRVKRPHWPAQGALGHPPEQRLSFGARTPLGVHLCLQTLTRGRHQGGDPSNRAPLVGTGHTAPVFPGVPDNRQHDQDAVRAEPHAGGGGASGFPGQRTGQPKCSSSPLCTADVCFQ